jgi:hypothetical protein
MKPLAPQKQEACNLYLWRREERGNISELISAHGREAEAERERERKANPYLACACAAAEEAPRWRPKFREQRHLSRTKSILCERERTRCTHTWTLWSPHPLIGWRHYGGRRHQANHGPGFWAALPANRSLARPHPALQNSHNFL